MTVFCFYGCVQYVTGKDEAKMLASDGVLLGSVGNIADSFEYQRGLNPRCSKPVGHIALSFKPEDKEKLTDGMMAKIAQEYMELMGIRDTQFIQHKKVIHDLTTKTWWLVGVGTLLFFCMSLLATTIYDQSKEIENSAFGRFAMQRTAISGLEVSGIKGYAARQQRQRDMVGAQRLGRQQGRHPSLPAVRHPLDLGRLARPRTTRTPSVAATRWNKRQHETTALQRS